MTGGDLLSLVNLFMCSVGGWICICRMAKMRASETKFQIRAQYAIWFGLFALSGWSFAVLGEEVDFVQLAMGAGIVAHLLLGIGAWRKDAPTYTRRIMA